eukprot:155553-Rhodomonas_salina.1
MPRTTLYKPARTRQTRSLPPRVEVFTTNGLDKLHVNKVLFVDCWLWFSAPLMSERLRDGPLRATRIVMQRNSSSLLTDTSDRNSFCCQCHGWPTPRATP